MEEEQHRHTVRRKTFPFLIPSQRKVFTTLDKPNQGRGSVLGRTQRRYPASPPCLGAATAPGDAAEHGAQLARSPGSAAALRAGGEGAARLAVLGSARCTQHKQPHMGIVWTEGAPWPARLSPDAIELT